MTIYDLGNQLTLTAAELYEKVLDKFGAKITQDFLKDATQEEKDSFIERMKKDQVDKLTDRLTLIMNRVLTDYHFIQAYDEMMEPHKSLEDLRRDNEIANNHLQSVENERSILQRDTDMAVDKLEILCESILERKPVTIQDSPSESR